EDMGRDGMMDDAGMRARHGRLFWGLHRLRRPPATRLGAMKETPDVHETLLPHGAKARPGLRLLALVEFAALAAPDIPEFSCPVSARGVQGHPEHEPLVIVGVVIRDSSQRTGDTDASWSRVRVGLLLVGVLSRLLP